MRLPEQNVSINPLISQGGGELKMSIALAPGTYAKGAAIGFVPAAVNEVQTVTLSAAAASGTFKLGFKGYSTTALAHNASAAAVQAALEALATIGTGNVGVALSGQVYTVTFQGYLAGQPVEALVYSENSLQSSVPAAVGITIATTAAGARKGSGRTFVDGDALCFNAIEVWVDNNGRHYYTSEMSGLTFREDTPVFIRGAFKAADLSGVTSDVKGAPGYREYGNAASDNDALVVLA